MEVGEAWLLSGDSWAVVHVPAHQQDPQRPMQAAVSSLGACTWCPPSQTLRVLSHRLCAPARGFCLLNWVLGGEGRGAEFIALCYGLPAGLVLRGAGVCVCTQLGAERPARKWGSPVHTPGPAEGRYPARGLRFRLWACLRCWYPYPMTETLRRAG